MSLVLNATTKDQLTEDLEPVNIREKYDQFSSLIKSYISERDVQAMV